MKYLRDTQNKKYPKEAVEELQTIQCSIHLLSPSKAQSVAEIINGHLEYDRQFACEPFGFSAEGIRAGILRLVELGFARETDA